MPVEPEYVKSLFWKHISGDPWIRSKLCYVNQKGASIPLAKASEADVCKYITKRKITFEKLTDKSWYINIYQAPSRRCENSAFLECLIQVDVLAPYAYAHMADEILSQIIALCTSREFNIYGDVPTLDADPGELAAPPGFYGVGARFLYYPSKETKIKKL